MNEPIKQPEALRLADQLEQEHLHTIGLDYKAASELRRQHAEIETLNDSCAAKADRIDRLGEQVVKLRAEVERLRTDAERYRWLRANRETRGGDGTMRDVYDDDGTLLYDDMLDAAIDAALKESTK